MRKFSENIFKNIQGVCFVGKFKGKTISLSCHLKTSGNLIFTKLRGKHFPFLRGNSLSYLLLRLSLFMLFFLSCLYFSSTSNQHKFSLCSFICLCATKLLCSNIENTIFKFIWFSHNIFLFITKIKLTNFHWKKASNEEGNLGK